MAVLNLCAQATLDGTAVLSASWLDLHAAVFISDQLLCADKLEGSGTPAVVLLLL
jgi:hypothetical protein